MAEKKKKSSGERIYEDQWDIFEEMVWKCMLDLDKKIDHAKAIGKPLSLEWQLKEHDRLTEQVMRQMTKEETGAMYMCRVLYPDPKMVGSVPPPLHKAAVAYLQFYLDCVEPFIFKYSEHPDNFPDPDYTAEQERNNSESGIKNLTGHIHGMYLITIYQIAAHKMSAVRKRYFSGLLRDSQVRLVEIAMQSHQDALRALIEEDERDPSPAHTLVKVCVEIQKQRNYMMRLLNSDDFRSERLELLLLRYLAEEDVNMDLVRALDQIQLDNMPNEFVDGFPIFKRVNPDMVHRRSDIHGILYTEWARHIERRNERILLQRQGVKFEY